MYPLLEMCSGGKAKTVAELVDEMSEWLALSAKQRQVRTKVGSLSRIESHTRRAADHLRKAGLVGKDCLGKGGKIRYKTTQKGERVVADPDIFELSRTY